MRLEGPGTGRACRALKVIKAVRLSSPCLLGPTHPPLFPGKWKVERSGEVPERFKMELY